MGDYGALERVLVWIACFGSGEGPGEWKTLPFLAEAALSEVGNRFVELGEAKKHDTAGDPDLGPQHNQEKENELLSRVQGREIDGIQAARIRLAVMLLASRGS